MPTRMSWKSNVRCYVFTAQMAMTSLDSLLEFFCSLKLIAMVRYDSPKHDTVAFSLGCIGIIINYEIYKDPITNPTQHFITLQFCRYTLFHDTFGHNFTNLIITDEPSQEFTKWFMQTKPDNIKPKNIWDKVVYCKFNCPFFMGI